jgi:hypothetical protein
MKWVPLDWISSKYEVSDTGMVQSLAKGIPRMLKPHRDRYGYLRVALQTSEGERKFYVHRLVLRAFTKVEGAQCNHKDGNKTNNVITNLEWCSASENVAHAYRELKRPHSRNNLGKFGGLHPCHIEVIQMLEDGTVVKIWGSLSDAARQGFSRQCIGHVCNGRQLTHKGFKWQYVV